MDAVRRFHEFGLYDVFDSIRLRARHIKGKVGWICVAEEEGKAAPGMLARRYSGIHLPVVPTKKRKSSQGDGDDNKVRDSIIAKLPPPLKQELRLDIHESLVGKSAFAFARLVRYVCRKDLSLVEVGAVNAYFQMTVPLLPGEAMQRYLDRRDEILGEVCYAFGVKRDQAKRLFIALGFGGSLSNWCSDVLGYIPEEDDPMAGEFMKTLHCFQTECRCLHILIEAAGKQLVSGGHNGVCIFEEASQRVLDAAERAGAGPRPRSGPTRCGPPRGATGRRAARWIPCGRRGGSDPAHCRRSATPPGPTCRSRRAPGSR